MSDASDHGDPAVEGGLRVVHPGPTTATTVADAYRAPLGEPDGRPWLGLCMVAALDGSTVVDGLSARLSSPTDTAVLAQLRSLADVILVGAGTVRDEAYGPPRTPGQRVGVVTASGLVDTSTPLFRSGAGFVVTTDETVVADGVDTIRAGRGRVDTRSALRRIGEAFGARLVQAEGGAQLNAALVSDDVIDEINLTTSPLVVGGAGPRLTTGAPDVGRQYELVQLAVDDRSFVYARWRRRR